MKNNHGITLIALVVTVIVLLILAGIGISMLTGNNGIIGNSNESKEETEISEEKSVVEESVAISMGKDKNGTLKKDTLQTQIDKITGEGKTEVSEDGEGFYVYFIESKRYYTIEKDGTVEQIVMEEADKYPGDITKDKDGNTLAGTEEDPYQIWCIEDLCTLSNMNNNSDYRVANWYAVKLMVDLDFNSIFSYVNGQLGVDGEIPSCSSKEELMDYLKTNGFIPIGNTHDNSFRGTFMGNNHKIENIYINVSTPAGLIGIMVTEQNNYVSDLTITGDIYCTGTTVNMGVGSIIGQLNSGLGGSSLTTQIRNCTNYATINSVYGGAGGIVGFKSSSSTSCVIQDCANYGIINGAEYVGGIIGMGYTNTTVLNCYNEGNVNAKKYAGGIIGDYQSNPATYNCYNIGKITSDDRAGGIIGWLYWSESEIYNCYNAGSITAPTKGGIIAAANISSDLLKMENCYYIDTSAEKVVGNLSMDNKAIKYTEAQLISSDFVDILNNYISNATIDTSSWKQWEYNPNTYPSFQ